MVGPAACCHANKTGMLVINKKSYAVQVDTVRSYSDFTECSLDLKHNCQVGTHTHGRFILDCRVTQTVVEVSVRMEWVRVNEVSGMITTPESVMRIGLFRYEHWANPLCGLDGSWPCGLDRQHADCNGGIGPIE
jgi:hypothetical protein